MKTLVQSLAVTFATLETFAGRGARTWRLRFLLLALLIPALILANVGAAETAGTVRITSGNGDFSAISASNKTLAVAPGTSLTGTVNLHTTNLGSSGWIAPLIFTPSWGDPSTSWQTINDWISTNPSDYQATVSVVAPTVPGVYHVNFAYFWEIGADHVASGTNWQVGADIWTDGDEIAKLSAARIAEAQTNGFTVAPRLVPTGSELFNTPADAITLIVDGAAPNRWDVSADYSITSNPAGAWSYGRKWTVDAAAMDLFPVRYTPTPNIWYLGNLGDGSPAVFGQGSPGPHLWAKYNSNGYPCFRWTCPKTGTYRLSGQFFGDEYLQGGNNYVFVVVKGATVFSSRIQNSQDVKPFAEQNLSLVQGETIDFTTTWSGVGDGLYGWIGLDTVIEEVNAAPTRETPVVRGPVAGESDGTRYLSFGTPQVGAFAATIQSGKTVSPVTVGPDGTVLLRVGGSVPGIAGSVITKLGQPSGDAVLATLKLSAANNITTRNNVVLLRGLSTGSPQVAARTGTANGTLPTEVTIKSFGAIDGNGSGVFFLATLQGKNVTPTNAAALCIALGDGSVKVLARRGDVVEGKTVATLGTLAGSAGTLGEGRWRVDEMTCGVRLTFNDAAKTQGVYAIPGTAASAADWTLLAQTGAASNLPAINGTSVRSLGLPGFGPGATAAVIANLAITPGGPVVGNHFALLSTAAGASAKVIARTGDPIATDANGTALTGVRIATFFDPVAGAGRQTAFAVNALRAGIPMRGIMFSENGDAPALLANIGAAAPGGGHWASLGALVFPDGGAKGPVFAGTVAVRAADGTTARNNRRLWAVDSTGTLRLLLRSGQSVTIGTATKTLSSFTALTAAPGSIGAASGHDTAGRVAVLATCTDTTRAILIVEIP